MDATADHKIAALEVRPRLTGEIVGESADTLVLRADGCTVEIPLRQIESRTGTRDSMEVSLRNTAEILVSAVVSIERGFVVDNVFGALNQGIFADNCNCNCNCNCTGDSSRCNCNCNCDTRLEEPAAPPVQAFRRPFTGGTTMLGGTGEERRQI